MSNTIEHTANVLKEIKAESMPGVIKSCKMPTLHDVDMFNEIGFVVILTLSDNYTYTGTLLNDWCKRLEASDYTLYVRRNHLIVRFKVLF